MNYPKQTKLLLVITALIFGVSQPAFTQLQSDFQIKRNFDRDVEQISRAVLEVETAEDAEALLREAEQLADRYGEHERFLDVLLYPESFSERVSYLRTLTDVTHTRIVRIEAGLATGEELEDLVSSMSDTLSEQREQIHSLSRELAETRRARDISAGQVRNLRAQVQTRDAFILHIVDSLFIAYDDLDLESLSPAERRELALEIDADNVFGHLESVVQNNISFLDTHTQLSSEDFLRLYATYYEFDQIWENIGPQLAQIYVGQQEREQRIEEISEMIDDWGLLIDDAVWQSLNAAFTQRNISLEPFRDARSFYISLNNYLDAAIERAEDGGSQEELEQYENFAQVWENDVKRRWQQHIITAGLMTYDNFATIDSKLKTWRLLSEPRSYAMLIYLGLALLVILALLALWIREKSARQTGGGQAAQPARPARSQYQPRQTAPRPETAPPPRPRPRTQPKEKKRPVFPKPDDDPKAAKEREERRRRRKY